MQVNIPPHDRDDLRIIYEAIVDYHNNLVHMRFTVAGLYLAATGFLASGLFNESNAQQTKTTLSMLGLILTIICLLLEIRTYQLLRNLSELGREYEQNFKIGTIRGFFALMKEQSLPPRFPILHSDLRQTRLTRYIISHSSGFDLLYICLAIFWIVNLLI